MEKDKNIVSRSLEHPVGQKKKMSISVKSLNISPKDTRTSEGGKHRTSPNDEQFEALQNPSPEPRRPGGEIWPF